MAIKGKIYVNLNFSPIVKGRVKTVPQLSTGLVIAGAYADKLRRVLFAQLRDRIKSGEIDSKTVAMRAGEINRFLFEVLVNKLNIDKGDVVRIRVEYEVKDGDIIWKPDTLVIEAFRRIPDNEVQRVVSEALKEYESIVARPVTEEERAWTEKSEAEVEREVKRVAEEARRAVEEVKPVELVSGEKFDISSAMVYAETVVGEVIALLKSSSGDNIGMAVLEPVDGNTRISFIVIPSKGEAYKATVSVEESLDTIRNNPETIVKAAKSAKYVAVPREEAESIIKRKLEQLK